MGPYKNASVDNGVRGRFHGLRLRMVSVDRHSPWMKHLDDHLSQPLQPETSTYYCLLKKTPYMALARKNIYIYIYMHIYFVFFFVFGRGVLQQLVAYSAGR